VLFLYNVIRLAAVVATQTHEICSKYWY